MLEVIPPKKILFGWVAQSYRRCLSSDRRGVTAVEYAIIVGLIAAAIVGSVPAIGVNLKTIFTNVGAGL